MNKVVIGVVIALVVISVAVVAVILADDNIWPTPWPPDPDPDRADISGAWGVEILVTYEDGTTKYVKEEMDNPFRIFSLTEVQGMEIISLNYILSARATGEGYTDVPIDYSGLIVKWELRQGTTIINEYPLIFSNSPIKTIPIDGAWNNIFTEETLASSVAPESVSPGTYTLHAAAYGSLRYQEGTTWKDGGLPDTVMFEVTVDDNRWLEIEFGSGYDTS